jgi:hypothetical protein
VAQGSLDELTRQRQSSTTRFVVRGDVSRAVETLKAVEGADKVQRKGEEAEASVIEVAWKGEGAGIAVERAIADLIAAGLAVREASPRKASLEETFAVLTEEDAEPGAPGGRAA